MDGEFEIERTQYAELPSPDEVRGMALAQYGDFLQTITFTDNERDLKPYIPVIIERFESDQTVELSDTQAWNYVHRAGENTRTFFWHLTHLEDDLVSPQQLDRLYKMIHSDNRRLRFHAIENVINVIRLDAKSRGEDQYLGLLDAFNEDVVKKVANSENPTNTESAQWMIDVVWAEYPGALPKLFVDAIKRAKSESDIRVVYSVFSNRIGASKANVELRKLATEDPSYTKRLVEIESALGFNHTESDLVNLYNKINFSDYKPNSELIDNETNLLLEHLSRSNSILDIGVGYGRHLLRLKERGKDVTGIDMVLNHLQAIKTQDKDANVVLASWRNMPFEDGHFDGGYILGRSLLHEVTTDGMIETLTEVKRVVRGSIVIDIPNPDKGHYAEVREKYAQAAENLGVVNYEEGSLIDSPDNQHFSERLAPSEDQFKAIAFLSGYSAQVIGRYEYLDEEGYSNENIYWRLDKLDRTPQFAEVMEALAESRTGWAPLFVTRI